MDLKWQIWIHSKSLQFKINYSQKLHFSSCMLSYLLTEWNKICVICGGVAPVIIVNFEEYPFITTKRTARRFINVTVNCTQLATDCYHQLLFSWGCIQIFKTDAVIIIKPTIRDIGRHHPRSSSLPHIDTGSTVPSVFGMLPRIPFLSDSQALSTIRVRSPQRYQAGVLLASISFSWNR
jgi:hypothetical protein